MVKCGKGSCQLSVLMCFFLTDIYFGDFAVLEGRSNLLANRSTFVTEQKALALWLNDGNWCALDVDGQTLCSVKSNTNSAGEEECRQHMDKGHSFEDANGCQCICVGSRKSCTLKDRYELVQSGPDNLLVPDDEFIGRACSSGIVWFDGNKWCACIQEAKYEIHTVFCTSNRLYDKTFTDNKCSASDKQLWKDGRTMCACSLNDQTVCISTFQKDNVDEMQGQRKNKVPNGLVHGLRHHVISLRDITSRRFASNNGDNPRHLASAIGARDVSCGGRPVGTLWSNSCNTCICTNSRVALCTAKHCRRTYGRPKVNS